MKLRPAVIASLLASAFAIVACEKGKTDKKEATSSPVTNAATDPNLKVVPLEEVLKELEAIQPKPETRTEVFHAVKRFVGWNEGRKEGTAVYTAEAPWVIKSVKPSVGGWGSYGHNLRKGAPGQATIGLQDIRGKFDSVYELLGSLQRSEKEKKTIELKIKDYEATFTRNLNVMASTHSVVFLDWNVKSEGKFYDQKRGMIDASLVLELERGLQDADLSAFVTLVTEALKSSVVAAPEEVKQ